MEETVAAVRAIPGTIWAVILTSLGAYLLEKTKNWHIKRTQDREDRKDFRETIKDMQDRMDKVEAEVDQWRSKYWQAQMEIAVLRHALIDAGIPVPTTNGQHGHS